MIRTILSIMLLLVSISILLGQEAEPEKRTHKNNRAAHQAQKRVTVQSATKAVEVQKAQQDSLRALGVTAPPRSNVNPWAGKSDAELRKIADTLAHRYIIVDGHVDLPEYMMDHKYLSEKDLATVPVQNKDGDFDYVRAKKGGLTSPFMSIYVPSSYQQTGGAKAYADSLINMVNRIALANPDKFKIARSPQDVERNFSQGIISLPMGMENGAPIGDSIENVAYFYKRGIRYITLTHATDNQISDSSYDSTGTWKGLSPFGKKVVQEMNLQGIMVDVSHVSDSAAFQAIALSAVPCIASHSSCRHFTPGFIRNMSDDIMKALAAKGGVIQISFGTSFLDEKLRLLRNQRSEKLKALLDKQKLKEEDAAAKPIVDKFNKENPIKYATIDMVADHIDHAVNLIGIDHVGLGSDFDGVGDSLPTGLKDVSQYPNLIYTLLKRGYSEEDISKICYKNVFRVWNTVQNYAKMEQERIKRDAENR